MFPSRLWMDWIKVHAKIKFNVSFGGTTYNQITYAADICGSCIIKLDFLKEDQFKLDFEKNELYSNSKDTATFKTESL